MSPIYSEDRNALYANLYALEQSAPFQNLKGLAIITPLTGMAAADIAAMAQNDIAVRYALHAFNPFALTGADYNQHNVNGVLDLVDYATHSNWINREGRRWQCEAANDEITNIWRIAA